MEGNIPCYKGIFGSPEEPFFNDKQHGVAPDILKEWLIELNTRNKEVIEKAVLQQDYFHHPVAISTIFKACEKFQLPNKVKYHTTDLFERFMLKHVQDLFEHLKTSESKNKRLEWEDILSRIQNQALLRLVSCVQISSKLVSHYKIVSVRKAKHFLRELDLKYSSTSILNSEIRILKTLNFNVMSTTPIVYIETILEIIGYNDPSLIVKPYHAVAVKILDVVYLNRREIYDELFVVIAKHLTPKFSEMESFNKVKADKLLLAISVLTAAVYVADQSKTDQVIEHLTKITKRSSDDILDFATVIVHSLIK